MGLWPKHIAFVLRTFVESIGRVAVEYRPAERHMIGAIAIAADRHVPAGHHELKLIASRRAKDRNAVLYAIAARIVFQRAAEAGDATAALALAATYDPGVLAKLGVVGMGGADVEKARLWYQRAESFGSTEAARRLRILAR